MIGYQLIGSGKEKVVVMHNWFGDATTYDPMIPYVDSQRFTFLFVDLRGYGRSRDIPGTFTVQEATNDVLEIVNSLAWEKFHVVGHSMSGMIAQKIAVDHVSRVKSVVAITPVPASGSPKPVEVMTFLEEAALTNESK